MRDPRRVGSIPVHWVASSKKDLQTFPQEVISMFGHMLASAQSGGKHPASKPWKGAGSGLFEAAIHYGGNAYRLVYSVRFSSCICVLHSFQKKSHRGIKTDKRDVQLVLTRLKQATEHFKESQ